LRLSGGIIEVNTNPASGFGKEGRVETMQQEEVKRDAQ